MAVTHRTIQAFHFGAAGEPSLVPIQLQTIEGEGVLQLPVLSTVFDTPAPIELAVITFQRSEKTFTALFAVLPRRKGGSERRSARGGVLPTAHVLVCRSSGAFAGYTDCVEEERDLAIMAANFAPRLWGDKAVNERGEFRAVIRESKQAARMT